MAFENDFPELAEATVAIFDMLGDLKLALKDGKVTIDEIVGLISDTGLKKSLRDGLEGLSDVPGEVQKLLKNPWNLMTLTQWLVSQLQRIFK